MDIKLPENSAVQRYLLPISLVLINLVLKLIYIGKWDISLDEPFTIYYAQQDIPAIFNMLATENNPPLFFLLLHWWIKLFGISAVAVRMLPVIFSSLTVFFIYSIGRKFFSLRIAILASLLFTFSGYHLLFSHEARVYSLFALLTAASFYLFFTLFKDPLSPKRYFFLLIAVNVLLIYSHFFGFLVIGVQWACVFSSPVALKMMWKRYLLVTFAVLVLYLPYFGLLLSRFSASAGGTWIPEPTITGLYNNIWKFSNAPVVTVFFLSILFLAFLKYLYLLISRKASGIVPPMTRFVITWFFLPYLGMFLLSYILPVFFDRYLVFISVGYYLLVAIAADYLGFNPASRWVIACILAGMMLFTFNPAAGNGRDIKGLVSTIRQYKTPGTVVYICPEWTDLQIAYYYDPVGFADYRNTRVLLERDSVFPVNSAEKINDSVLLKAKRVIYLDGWAELVDKENKIGKKISAVFPGVEKIDRFHGFTLYVFSR